MNEPTLKTKAKAKFRNARSFVLILIGIAVNVALSRLVGALGLPLYLDVVGTVIVSSLSGYIPGIIVGLVTNIIKSFSDTSSMYYGTLNVLIALVAAFATRRKFYKKVYKVIITIFVCAFIGGVGGSILTWLLYGFANVGVTSSLAQKIYETGHFSEFWAQFTADFLTDLADKAITIIIVTILLLVLPDAFKRSVRLYGWKQEPLNHELKAEVRNVVTGVASLRTKLIVLISAAMIIMSIAALSIGVVLYRRGLIESRQAAAMGIAEYAAGLIEANRVDEYIEKGREAEGYDETEDILYAILESSPDIVYLYIYKINEDGYQVVFDLDTQTLEGEAPGTYLPLDNQFADNLPDMIKGNMVDPIVTDDDFGYLMTVCVPVYDRVGTCRCYSCVDVSMTALNNECYSYLTKQLSLFLGVFILILAVGLWLAHYNIIVPVNSMAISAGEFAYENEEAMEESVERLKHLDIRTGDEIENLYHSFVKTSEDSVHYVSDIQTKTETISRMQTGLILVLADMVESRDECTGDHVRKTAAYAGIILHGLRDLGYYTDIITDSYITDVVNAAPLHDIGKIKVSDAILNKPGKLNDIEFEKMKTHTTAGRDIIMNAIKIVPDTGYLTEAKNLAEYHHEKWNGNGYPHGLSGEDIPLSARVLAIADVFDALLSKRSYKEPFPFDKAVGIIREGSGSHFDPKCVEAFDLKIDEIKAASEKFFDINNKNYDNGVLH